MMGLAYSYNYMRGSLYPQLHAGIWIANIQNHKYYQTSEDVIQPCLTGTPGSCIPGMMCDDAAVDNVDCRVCRRYVHKKRIVKNL